MRRKGDRIVNGKVVHAEEQVTVTGSLVDTVDVSAPMVQAVSVAEPAPEEQIQDTEFPAKGLELSQALKAPKDSEMKVNEQDCLIHIRSGRIEVTMTGFWDGRLLSAAMRAIEKKYDEVRRHATVWAMKQAQQSNQS